MCVYACQRESQRRKRLRFSVYFCVVYVLEPLISHLLLVHPWDIGKIFLQPMQSDSWENDSIVAHVACPPCYEKADGSSLFPYQTKMIMWEITNMIQSVFSPDGPVMVMVVSNWEGPKSSTYSPKLKDETGYLSLHFETTPCERSSKVIVPKNFTNYF